MTLPRPAAGRLLAALMLASLAACAVTREPAYDAAIAGAVTDLSVESRDLFAGLSALPPEPFAARAPLYRRLSARAEAIAALAGARPAPPPAPIAEAGNALLSRLLARRGITPEDMGAEYAEATPAFMADYLRNLSRLEAADRATPDGPPETRLARRRVAALTEVLRDALTYETRILKRGQ